MRLIYTLLYTLFTPLIVLRLIWRARRDRRYAQGIPQRFARHLPGAGRPDSRAPIWVHAVSLGEMRAVSPLLGELGSRGHALWLTSTTPTGYAEAERQRAGAGNMPISVSRAPLDLIGVQHRFHRAVRPAALLMMETEIWPNQLAVCRALGVPSALINARLSERSLAGYRRARWALGDLGWAVARSDADAARFAELGVRRIEVGGDLKYDMPAASAEAERGRIWRERWGPDPLWIAGSTHPGEDEQALRAHRLLRQRDARMAGARLVLVPRHPERAASVLELVRADGWRCVELSGAADAPTLSQGDFEVAVVGATGLLVGLYAAGDAAWVGGSLVPRGGHNLYEPLAVGTPALSGTHLHNFEPMRDALLEAGTLRLVQDAEQLARELARLMGPDRSEALRRIEAFRRVNGGAAERIRTIVERMLAEGAD
ncbi:MAG: 3-deoxy-D-manno-octulosonic acid transferase [Gammaproteobacteria bacterium AqS3]|nr:3-deoxy-D-manno-octulosonic acid transferase [Gammaproteobacteria bacterium AqS3]